MTFQIVLLTMASFARAVFEIDRWFYLQKTAKSAMYALLLLTACVISSSFEYPVKDSPFLQPESTRVSFC